MAQRSSQLSALIQTAHGLQVGVLLCPYAWGPSRPGPQGPEAWIPESRVSARDRQKNLACQSTTVLTSYCHCVLVKNTQAHEPPTPAAGSRKIKRITSVVPLSRFPPFAQFRRRPWAVKLLLLVPLPCLLVPGGRHNDHSCLTWLRGNASAALFPCCSHTSLQP